MIENQSTQHLHDLRHTAEHVLHMAMDKLYGKKVLRAMGPATDEGFYFDFDSAESFKFSAEQLPAVEQKMQEIIDADYLMHRVVVSVPVARRLFADNHYKLEWIEGIENKNQEATIYLTGTAEQIAADEEILAAAESKSGGNFGDKSANLAPLKLSAFDFDLCSGPHVERTGEIKAFKLLSIAGAYWHGDEKNKMLTRIYGTAFFSQAELNEYLDKQEEAKRRDHRKLGKELDLFAFSPLVGSGFPLYTQRGALVRRLLNNFVEEEQIAQGYYQVWTPQVAKAELFKISGHYDKYKADMFKVVSNYSDEEMFLKPMNCPHATQIFASQSHSYRDLPIRLTDFAMLYRDERPGELNGLARVRSFSQDDCHIFCREDQVDVEVDRALSMTKKIMNTFGFKYRYRLSTRDLAHPEKYSGDPKVWDKVEAWAVEIMKRNQIEYYDGPGEAAFYAPKMDLMATDALGREWQLSTVQIDYVMPERFNLEYVDSDGQLKRPVMLHRAIIGSAERMMMILIEHYGGAFPTWLAPVQATVVSISQDQFEYGEAVVAQLKAAGIRADHSHEAESMQNRIRKAEGLKVPYMLVVGKREEEAKSVAVRARGNKNLGVKSVAEFVADISQEIKDRSS